MSRSSSRLKQCRSLPGDNTSTLRPTFVNYSDISYCSWDNWNRNITRRSIYTNAGFYARKQLCLQRVLAIAILSVCLFVCLSVTRMDQAKTVQARITKFLPSAAQKTLVSGTVKLFHKFEGVTPNKGAEWEGGGQNLRFLAHNSLYLSNGAR